jgi:hypothetical protein
VPLPMALPEGEEVGDGLGFVARGRTPEAKGGLECEVMIARQGGKLGRSLHDRAVSG